MRLTYLLPIALGLGCGWLNKNLTTIKFNLPKKSFTVDASELNLPPGGVPAVPCGAGGIENCCDPAPGMVPATDCKMYPLSCEGTMCALTMPVQQVAPVDLGMEVPELKSFSGQTAANIDLTSISYDIASSLNTDLPAVDLYLAPGGVMSTTDPQAHKIGTIPATPAGTQNQGEIVLTDDGRAAFRNIALDFNHAFNMLAATTITANGGAPTPMGKVDMTIGGTGQASLNI